MREANGQASMGVQWHKPEDVLPGHGQECLLMPRDHGGLTTVGVFGPIAWHEESRMWLDIFRDADAGCVVKPDQVGLWTLWEPIAPQEAE